MKTAKESGASPSVRLALALLFGVAALAVGARGCGPLARILNTEGRHVQVSEIAAGARPPTNRLTLEGRVDHTHGVRVTTRSTRVGSQVGPYERQAFVFPLVQPGWREGDPVFVFVRTAPLESQYRSGEAALADGAFTGTRTALDGPMADRFVLGGLTLGEGAFVLDLDPNARGDGGDGLPYLLALAALCPLALWFLASALFRGSAGEPALVRFARAEALSTARWFLIGGAVAAAVTAVVTDGNPLDAPVYKTLTGATLVALSLWGFVQALRAPPDADDRVQALCHRAQKTFPELSRWLDAELDGAPIEKGALQPLRTAILATGGPDLICLIPLDDVVCVSNRPQSGEHLVVVEYAPREPSGAASHTGRLRVEHRLPAAEAARVVEAIVTRRPDLAPPRAPAPSSQEAEG